MWQDIITMNNNYTFCIWHQCTQKSDDKYKEILCFNHHEIQHQPACITVNKTNVA